MRSAEERDPRQELRFDVALLELRLFKSRAQAAAAIAEAQALLNGGRVKPSHAVRPGDRITVAGPGAARTVEVVALPSRSLSKEAAKALVRDVPTPDGQGVPEMPLHLAAVIRRDGDAALILEARPYAFMRL